MKVDINNRTICIGNNIASFEDILHNLHPYADDIIFLAGSLIEGALEENSKGMGNDHSDVDVFIIREHQKFVDTKAVYTREVRKTLFCDNILTGLDIEVYDKDYVDSILRGLEYCHLSKDERSRNALLKFIPKGGSFTEINYFLNRLMYSVCIYNYEKFIWLKNHMNFNRFLDLGKNNLIASIDNEYPDIVGNLQAGQLDVAITCIREMYFSLIKVILSNEGIFVDRNKWIPLKFRNLVKRVNGYEEVWNEYGKLFYSDIQDRKKCEETITSALNAAHRALEKLLLGGIEL